MISDKYKSVILTTFVFLILSFVYEMPFWLSQPPRSVHVWRQSDCASYALNYYQNDRGFFEPQVHHRHAVNGATTSEFPIIYYVAGKIYKIFGFKHYVIRWINYVILFASLICLTLVSRFYIKNWILVTFPAILVMMSCVIMYYGSNFLPDVPALSFALIGFYFFIKNYHENNFPDFSLSVVFGTLASLLKISSAILFLTSICFIFIHKFILKENKYSKKHFFLATLGLISILLWLFYVKFYNATGQFFGNLQGTLSYLTINDNERLYILQRTFNEWMPALISKKIWWFFIPVLLFIAFSIKKLDLTLKIFLPVTLIAVVVYLFLFFAVFNVHDYYFINVFCFPALLSIAAFQLIENHLQSKSLNIFIVLSFILFVMCGEDAHAQFRYRRFDQGWNSVPLSSFYHVEPYLRKLGIDRTDLIYSPTDPTPNATLYLVNNPGWSSYLNFSINDAKARGAKYMIIETSKKDEEQYKEFSPDIIGEFEGLSIIKFK